MFLCACESTLGWTSSLCFIYNAFQVARDESHPLLSDPNDPGWGRLWNQEEEACMKTFVVRIGEALGHHTKTQ